jgi:hypothetical protein
VAAGTFFLSYPGVHAIARQGGVSGQLARFYPALFDAVLVIACVAAVTLSHARWWARAWAWLVAIVLLAAIGMTDVLHAMNYGLRQRPTEGVIAAAPVAAVLLAFSLFLTMLRQSRTQSEVPDQSQASGDDAAEPPTAPMLFSADGPVTVLAAGSVARPPAPPIALPAAPALFTDGPADFTDGPEAAPTREMPAVADDASDADRDAEGTAGEPGLSVTAGAEPGPSHPATVPNDVIEPAASSAAAEPAGEPLAGTADATASQAAGEAPSDEPPADEPEAQSPPAEPASPQPIRYASSAAAEQFGDEDWEAEVDPALAGQVYPVLTSDPDIEVPPHEPGQAQDLEDDAPPFATAPFASVPRLNRVRVSPTPPTDDVVDTDDDE